MQRQAGTSGGTFGGIVNPEDPYGSSLSTSLLNPSLAYGAQGQMVQPAAAVAASSGSSYTGPFAGTTLFNRSFSFYLGIILVLFLIKYAAEHQAVNLETSYIHIGILNFVIIALAAKLGDLTLKWLTSIWQIPGLSDVAAA